jgi:hypothetical protein
MPCACLILLIFVFYFFQWHLVCDRAQLVNVAEMMFLAGVAVGGLVSGMVSDR